MKKRIIALILVVVMSLLAFAGCAKSVDFVEDIGSYAKFKDGVDFKAALQALEIEDGDFTNSEAKRVETIKTSIYNSVVSGILNSNAEHKTEGNVDGGDVLYFVYYAVDKDNNVFYYSNMNEATAENKGHVIKLGDSISEDDKFMTALQNALLAEDMKDKDVKDYIYDMYTATEIKDANKADANKAATEYCEQNHKDDTAHKDKDGKTAAQLKEECIQDKVDELLTEDLKLEAGKKYVIMYTRSKNTAEGGVINEAAKYEEITLDSTNEFHKILLENAILNELVKVDNKETTDNTTDKTGDIKVGDYTYKNVKVLWEVKPVEHFVSVTIKPFGASTAISPDSVYNASASGSTNTVSLDKDSELTYYVYPVYYVDAPAVEEINGEHILKYIVGSNISENSYDAFKDATYVDEETNTTKPVSELVTKIKEVFDTKNETHYANGTDLNLLLKAYDKAVAAGNSTTEQKNAIADAKAALLAKQIETITPFVVALNAATTDENGKSAIYDEEYENKEHTLVKTYNQTIVENVQKAVWTLIQDSVEVTKYPEKALKEYYKMIYDDYEFQFYHGDTNGKANVDAYGTLTNYLIKTLKVADESKIEDAITAQAQAKLKLIIQIYYVASVFEAEALANIPGYVEADIAAGAYEKDEDKESARKEAKLFYVDNDYMKHLKKEVGRRFYKDLISQYGELTIRASHQFNKIFYYLTCTELVSHNDGDHAHTEVKATLTGDVWSVNFRNVKYVIKAEEEKTED